MIILFAIFFIKLVDKFEEKVICISSKFSLSILSKIDVPCSIIVFRVSCFFVAPYSNHGRYLLQSSG